MALDSSLVNRHTRAQGRFLALRFAIDREYRSAAK
jgi:hypothetical protein